MTRTGPGFAPKNVGLCRDVCPRHASASITHALMPAVTTPASSAATRGGRAAPARPARTSPSRTDQDDVDLAEDDEQVVGALVEDLDPDEGVTIRLRHDLGHGPERADETRREVAQQRARRLRRAELRGGGAGSRVTDEGEGDTAVQPAE